MISPDGDPFDQIVDQTIRIIQDYGWGIVATVVGGTLTVYTVGLTGQNLPELMVLGMPFQEAARLLNPAGLAHATDRMRPGMVWRHGGGSYRLQWPAGPYASALYLAYRIYGQPRVSVLELVDEETRQP